MTRGMTPTRSNRAGDLESALSRRRFNIRHQGYYLTIRVKEIGFERQRLTYGRSKEAYREIPLCR